MRGLVLQRIHPTYKPRRSTGAQFTSRDWRKLPKVKEGLHMTIIAVLFVVIVAIELSTLLSELT